MSEHAYAVKGAVPFHSCKDISDKGWEGQTAIDRIRRYCSSDGSGDKDKMDWDKYELFFAYRDSANPNSFGALKLPHHDIVDGKFVLLKRKLAMNVGELHGGRAGGLRVPESDLSGIQSHLRKHYEEDLKEPFPEGKPSTTNATKAIHPADQDGPCKTCKAVAAVARTIKHSGDYGQAFYNHETQTVHHTMANGDGDPDYDGSAAIKAKYLAIDGVKTVEIGDESSPSEDDGYYQVHPEPRREHAEKSMPDDTLICFGGAVKSLGDGRIGGYLVRFSGPNDPDLTSEYFTKSTDFWFDGEPTPGRRVIYHHGFDPKMEIRKLAQARLKLDEVGVWAEAQLDLRDEYERKINEMAVAGKLGWSSG